MAFWWPCNRPFLGFCLLFLSWTEVMENPSTPLERAIVNLLILKLFVWSSQETGPQNLRNFIVLCLVVTISILAYRYSDNGNFSNKSFLRCLWGRSRKTYYCKRVIFGSYLACRWISYLITNISTFQFDPELVDKVNH